MVKKEEFETIFAEQAVRFWKTSYSKVIYNYLKLMREHTLLAFKPAEYAAVKKLAAACKMPRNARELANVVESPFFKSGITQLVDYLYDADYKEYAEMDPKEISQDSLRTVWKLILDGQSELLQKTESFQQRLADNFDDVLQFFYELQQTGHFEQVNPEFYKGISEFYAANSRQSGTTETYFTLQGIYMNFIGSLENHFSKFIKPKDAHAGAFNKFDDYLHYYESTAKILRPFYKTNHESDELGSAFDVLPEHRRIFSSMRPEIADAIAARDYSYPADDKVSFGSNVIGNEEFDRLCEESNIVNTNMQWLFIIFSYRNCLTGTLCRQSYKGDDLKQYQNSVKDSLQGIDVFLKYCMPV